MKRKKVLLTVAIPIVILAAVILYWCSDAPFGVCMKIPSPTDAYTLEIWYADKGAFGYRGRVYLVADGRRYFVERFGPSRVSWKDEETIVLSDGWNTTQYRVEDIIR